MYKSSLITISNWKSTEVLSDTYLTEFVSIVKRVVYEQYKGKLSFSYHAFRMDYRDALVKYNKVLIRELDSVVLGGCDRYYRSMWYLARGSVFMKENLDILIADLIEFVANNMYEVSKTELIVFSKVREALTKLKEVDCEFITIQPDLPNLSSVDGFLIVYDGCSFKPDCKFADYACYSVRLASKSIKENLTSSETTDKEVGTNQLQFKRHKSSSSLGIDCDETEPVTNADTSLRQVRYTNIELGAELRIGWFHRWVTRKIDGVESTFGLVEDTEGDMHFVFPTNMHFKK